MGLVVPLDNKGRPSPVRVKRPSERRSSSRSATRALDVLEYLGHVRRPVRAVEISRALGMHPSTTNQLLKTMVDSSHLIFDARMMTYSPSPRLIGFSGWLIATYPAGEQLRDMVRDVGSRTGMITTLTTVNDVYMQILDLVAPEGGRVERGQRVSLFGSAIGSAYLSTLGEPEIRRLAERARIPHGDLARICIEIDRVRKDGWADGPSLAAQSGPADTIWSVAVPLPPDAVPLPLVLGLAGPAEQVRRNRDLLRQCLQAAIDRWISSGHA